jgi:hypothetical protein
MTSSTTRKLSERRAWAAHAFIVKNPSAWETLYNHDDERWGVPVIQEILADLGYDPGDKSAKLTKETKQAMRDFLKLEGEGGTGTTSNCRPTSGSMASAIWGQRWISGTSRRIVTAAPL